MKINSRLFVFMLIFFFGLSLPGLNAGQELPFDNPNLMISMDFQNASLKDVLKIFSIQSGLNFIASEAVKDRSLTVYFDKVPIREAMDKLFLANNLAYELDRDSNIFIVKDLGKPQVELETKVFYLKYASVSSSHIMEEVANNLGSSGSSRNSGGTASSTGTSGSTGDRYAVAGDIGLTTAVKKLLSKDGSVIEDYRTNSLIIQDIPTRIPIIAECIASLDVPTPQVLIEVEMLDVSKGSVDKLGFKFGQSPLSLALTGPLLTGAGANFPLLGSTLAKIGSTTGQSKSFTPGTLDFSPSGSSYSVVLDFLKTQSDTKFLARPRILTLNNETAEFRITTKETVSVTQTSTTIGSQGAQVGDTIERQETGIVLRVTPQVDGDSGEITMFIMPEIKETSNSGLTTSQGTTIKDPETRTTKSIVRINDGETVILGGLIRNRRTETVTKLPVLADIPVLGAMFRNKNKDQDTQRELLVFITPHIVRENKKNLAKFNPADLPRLPQREQDTVSVVDRQAVVNASLSSYEKK